MPANVRYKKALLVPTRVASGDFYLIDSTPGYVIVGTADGLWNVPETLSRRIVVAEWEMGLGNTPSEWKYRGASMAELMCFQTGGEWWRDDINFDVRRDLTLREIQAQLPWSIHYKTSFRECPMPHKHFSHALTHVSKALGKLHALVDDAEHKGCEFTAEETDYLLADLVICAFRAANTIPGRICDLQHAVEYRLEKKNDIKLRR